MVLCHRNQAGRDFGAIPQQEGWEGIRIKMKERSGEEDKWNIHAVINRLTRRGGGGGEKDAIKAVDRMEERGEEDGEEMKTELKLTLKKIM